MKLLYLMLICCNVCFMCCAKSKSLPPPAPGPELGQVMTHRVTRGETWQSIARDFYGDEGRARELAQDNGSDLLIGPREGSTIRVLLAAHEGEEVKAKLEASRVYNEGLDLASAGSYAEATIKFQQALKLNPHLHDASFNLAIAYQKLGYHRKAIDILRDLLIVVPGNTDYKYALGASLFASGEVADARRTFSDVLDKDPTNRKALFSYAVACEKTGKYDQARDSFERYLQLDPQGEWAESARSHLESLRQRR
jgi:tetratricopeptide (TPR) repeat protein